MKGYKGFNSKLQCSPKDEDFQYEIGKAYTHFGDIELCKKGFHFCENPMDVLNYYAPGKSRYAEVEAQDVSSETGGDSKRVAKSIHIQAELTLSALIGAGVKFILDRVDWKNSPSTNTGNWSAATNTGDQSAATNTGNQSAATNTGDGSAATNTGYQSAATNTGDWSAATTTGNRSAATNTGNRSAATNTGNQSAATNTGDWSAATTTGYQSAATNTGDQSAATNTGDWSAATNTGKEGCAISLGIEGKASAEKGCWIILAEWKQKSNGWHRIAVKTAKVDGKRIKANTFYRLQEGKFIQVEE